MRSYYPVMFYLLFGKIYKCPALFIRVLVRIIMLFQKRRKILFQQNFFKMGL